MPRFSQVLLEHACDPCNQGAMENADLVGRASINGNPPFISIFLAISDNKVRRATFEAHGCGVTTAICSVTTELVVAKTIQECRLLTVDAICTELKGVPPDKLHCVHVCLKALHNAVNGEPHVKDS